MEGRKPLDLALLNKEIENRQTGKRNIKRILASVERLTEGCDKFNVVESDVEEITIYVGHDLPSDQEIEELKSTE